MTVNKARKIIQVLMDPPEIPTVIINDLNCDTGLLVSNEMVLTFDLSQANPLALNPSLPVG